MDLVIIVVVLALFQYVGFSFMVGMKRGKYNVEAPAVSGDPMWERYYRVQMNTLEQLAVFLPAIFLYSHLGNPTVAAGLGAVYIIGRFIYLRSYVADPGSRAIGFMLTFLPSVYMLGASLYMAIRNML